MRRRRSRRTRGRHERLALGDQRPTETARRLSTTAKTTTERSPCRPSLRGRRQPERTLIPTNQGASDDDYSLSATSLTFGPTETSRPSPSRLSRTAKTTTTSRGAQLRRPARQGERRDHPRDDRLHQRRRRSGGDGELRALNLQRRGERDDSMRPPRARRKTR